MHNTKLNAEILSIIIENSKEDIVIRNYLFDIMDEELKNPGRWTDLYKTKIKEYIKKWRDNNAD